MYTLGWLETEEAKIALESDTFLRGEAKKMAKVAARMSDLNRPFFSISRFIFFYTRVKIGSGSLSRFVPVNYCTRSYCRRENRKRKQSPWIARLFQTHATTTHDVLWETWLRSGTFSLSFFRSKQHGKSFRPSSLLWLTTETRSVLPPAVPKLSREGIAW